jgi:hypothetical protein
VCRTILPSDKESAPAKQTTEKAAAVQIDFSQKSYLHEFDSDDDNFPITDQISALTGSETKQKNDQRIFGTAICSLEEKNVKCQALVDTGATTNVIRSNNISMELGYSIPMIQVDETTIEYAWKMKDKIGINVNGIPFDMEAI